MKLTVGHVLAGLIDPNLISLSQRQISHVVIDSRQATPDSLFVALPGENVDGHAYVANAFDNGAIIAIVHDDIDVECSMITSHQNKASFIAPCKASFAVPLPICIKVDDTLQGLQQLAAYWRRQFSPTVIGITGSIGKTSTKEVAYCVLSSKYNTLKSEGNYNNEIGLPLSLLRLDDSHEKVILEMGMYDVGEIAELCQIAQPQIGMVTNVNPVHLERLGTIERIMVAKQELVEALPADGLAILNMDDSRVMAMRHHCQAKIFTYGLSPKADLWADQITSQGLQGIRFVFHLHGERIHAKIPLLGRHSVHTALRAAALGLTQGMAWDEILAGLQRKGAQLRLTAVPGPNGSLILDDTYNASPASSIAALDLLHEVDGERKIAVLSDMAELGAYEKMGHRKVGVRAAHVVDLLITVGDKAQIIAEEAISCGLTQSAVHSTNDIYFVIECLKQITQPNDIILIKGSRSMHLEQIVKWLTH